MSLQFVIDGYNIIRHPTFIQASNKKIKDKKLALLELIKTLKLTGSPKNRACVVFDGFPDSVWARGPYDKYASIDIVFSKEESADEKIKKIVEGSANPKTTVVVSDDKEIKFLVRVFGARALGIEEFIRLKRRSGRKEDSLTEIELSYSQRHKINEELRRIWLK